VHVFVGERGSFFEKRSELHGASRALHGAEANYSTINGELLALVWATTIRFRSYLYGGPTFVARVDHNPLVWLHQQVNLQGRLARWHICLMEFNFTVEHRAGRAHSNVDPLSRNPVATLPWEVEAGGLDDFPKSAAPEFQTQDPPAHPTVQVFSLVNEDVDSSEGIGKGAATNAGAMHARRRDFPTFGNAGGRAKQSTGRKPYHATKTQTSPKTSLLAGRAGGEGVPTIYGMQMVHLW
jgi:hypothetical protein